jgi:hypothetical protein
MMVTDSDGAVSDRWMVCFFFIQVIDDFRKERENGAPFRPVGPTHAAGAGAPRGTNAADSWVLGHILAPLCQPK